jgi:hypothetical protein
MARFYFDEGLRLISRSKLLSVSRQNKFIAGLFALCAVLWIIAAIHPVDRYGKREYVASGVKLSDGEP